MPENTIAQGAEVADPKLKALAMRVVKTMRLGAEKVVAHYAKPVEFPITADPNSMEQIFLSRFRTLHESKKQAAVARVMANINAPEPIKAGYYGDLSKVNLRLQTEVVAQVKALKFPETLKFPLSHLNSLTKFHGQILAPHLVIPGGIPSGPIPLQTTDKLEFRIHGVRCADETDGLLGTELGQDEIALSGIKIDETGDVNAIPKLMVGSHFEDNVLVAYSPPKRLTHFMLNEGTTWPKFYSVILVLAELDMGGLPGFVSDLYPFVKAQVVGAVGVAAGTIAGPVVAVIIGALVNFVLDEIFRILTAIWNDDFFIPAILTANIAGFNSLFAGGKKDSPEGTVHYRGHGGYYRVRYDWRLFA